MFSSWGHRLDDSTASLHYITSCRCIMWQNRILLKSEKKNCIHDENYKQECLCIKDHVSQQDRFRIQSKIFFVAPKECSSFRLTYKHT